MIRVLTVFGTRPEAIKLAPVIKELERRPDLFDVRICVSGQHRELLDRMLELFAIRPHHDLDVMRDDQSPADVTVAVLEGLRQVFREEEPDWVLVQGDTTTTMAGGLGAFYHGCRVAHVEAGLRTFDQHDPWPEEMNRRFTGVVADLHFAPTPVSARNLFREGVDRSSVYVTGNTVVDALEIVSAMRFAPERSPLAGLPLEGKRVVVATMHRRQTSQAALREICCALRDVAEAYEDVLVVCPVHPNPNVKHPISDLLAAVPDVALIAPLDYKAMIWLLRRCRFVVTDSGGLQEEAASLGRPALVVRGRTERPEGVAAGTAKLVGTDRRTIARWARRLLDDPALYERMARSTASYGRGDAAVRIVDILAEHSNGLERTSPARR